MVDEQDWAACMDSEIFRNYVSAELRKEAEIEANRPAEEAAALHRELEGRHEAFAKLEEFEKAVRRNPGLLENFRRAKQALVDHPEILEKVDKKFINGLMMLDLGE